MQLPRLMGSDEKSARGRGFMFTFKNIVSARSKVQQAFGFDFADSLSSDEWDCACRVFQKRHFLAHKMGVIDTEYLQKANDPAAVAGRKIHFSHDEVSSAI